MTIFSMAGKGREGNEREIRQGKSAHAFAEDRIRAGGGEKRHREPDEDEIVHETPSELTFAIAETAPGKRQVGFIR